MKLSIVIPSIREKALQMCIQSIRRTKCPHEIEIVVVSPTKCDAADLWIEDTEISGCVAAFNKGCYASTGEYIFVMPDDHTLYDDWWKPAESVEQTNYAYPIVSYRGHYFYNSQILVPMYFCFHKILLSMKPFNGKIFNPAYKHQFVDCDLGFRLYHETGQSVPLLRLDHIKMNNNFNFDNANIEQKNKYFAIDQLVFFLCWNRLIENHRTFFDLNQQVFKTNDFIKEDLITAATNLRCYR